MAKKSNFKVVLKVIKKKVKLRYLLLLIVLLVSNTFAWFIYNTQVDNKIDVHVRAWRIVLTKEDSQISDYVTFNVQNVYPGMTDYTDSLKVYNQGEIGATLRYTIMSANILGTEYISKEGRAEKGENAVDTDLSSGELEQKLASDYPFKISFKMGKDSLVAEEDETTYTLTVTWAYESGDDAMDTYYGNLAYDYIHNNPNTSCITLKVKIDIAQENTSGN